MIKLKQTKEKRKMSFMLKITKWNVTQIKILFNENERKVYECDRKRNKKN